MHVVEDEDDDDDEEEEECDAAPSARAEASQPVGSRIAVDSVAAEEADEAQATQASKAVGRAPWSSAQTCFLRQPA